MHQLFVPILAAFFAALVSGAAGFGGALLLLPILAATVGPEKAVPLLTIVQLVGNLSRVAFGFGQIRWRPVTFFLLGALPFSIIGAWSFVRLPGSVAGRCIGAAILLLLALRSRMSPRHPPGTGWMVVGGGLVGFISGLVGSAGPLGAAVFLSLGLPPVSYIASEAVSALAMHATKIAVYQRYIVPDRGFWLLAFWMGLAMVLGTWTAKRTVERLPPAWFHRGVVALLVLLGLYLLAHG